MSRLWSRRARQQHATYGLVTFGALILVASVGRFIDLGAEPARAFDSLERSASTRSV